MIELRQLTVHAGNFELRDISFIIPKGGYGVLMGKTGCGKTTILESIIGFRDISAGKIFLCGTDVTDWSPALRGIGYVPQDGALFSRMNVRRQLGFALSIRRIEASVIRDRTEELAELLGISHILDRTPKALSGGERQRVALGRALSFEPKVLCLDEPLSALDSETRLQMCELLTQVRQRTGVTTLHVTHNLDEAERLAAPLFQLRDGQLDVA